MDSVKRSVVTPSKSGLARAIAKALHIRAVTGVAPDDDGILKDHFKHVDEDEEELLQDDEMVREVFLSKLFASVTAVKAAYAEMQFAQSPHDADGIQAADRMVVSKLKYLSELKQAYLTKQLNEATPATTLLLSEIQERKSSLRIYEVTAKKLESQLQLKEAEAASLRGKLLDANKANTLLEKRLSSSGQFVVPENVQLSDTRVGDFLSYHRQTLKSIRSFVQLLIKEMGSAGWDLDAAADSIEPGTRFRNPSHKCFAFESFVCKQMFDGFNCPDFSSEKAMPERDKRHVLFLNRYIELISAKPKSPFASFCRAKYLRVVHPKVEASLFGSLESVASSEPPGTPFFSAFCEMAKRVWLLRRLALSFEPGVSAFQGKKGDRFSEVYMESLGDDARLQPEPLVALSVVPGFKIGKTIVQCQVYLC
ncbi:protein GRAVITROPIC IN THE LIGHT 1-like [Salvia splendens]|uniref:protein GRAVITROPIC IN THE LIGHT 1-like n=1 Tax=Salvia splendens TaxID=180675 RepID=UPI001C26E765|nr:protein GRAVITROPIC IN THE LIGHT 1-like [Salvia splendens]XP_042022348.1 protein GRAVITROPIC IN THE LIGHT 1-like [Salvia splendens]